MNDFGDRIRAEERKTPIPQNTKVAKKTGVKDESTPKKKLGRPRIHPPKDPNAEKKVVRWKKGQSGNPKMIWPKGFCPNPGGRPKKTPITDAMRELLHLPHPAKKYGGMTFAQVLAMKELELAIESGDMRAAQEITDRVEGKIPQGMQHSGPGGGAIAITNLSPEENEKRIAMLEALARGDDVAEGESL